MKRRLRLPLYFLILIGLYNPLIAKADVWDIPRVKIYYSENKEYKLIITPSITPEKYYQWCYFNRNRHPQTKKILRRKAEFMKNISEKDTILIPCIAQLYQIKEADSVLVWKRNLLNQTCPVYAIIANDGSSVATIDNWFSTGYGENVFVVYDEKGNARNTYKLEDISPFPLNDYMMTISSLHWNAGLKYITNDKIEILFETDDNRESYEIYNIEKSDFEK